jgi:putative transposase
MENRVPIQAVDESFRLPDAIWERMELLLPKYRASKKGGRPRLGWRTVLDGIFYVLRTGCQWKAVPKAFGSGSSLHRYFQVLVEKEVFERLWVIALLEYDDLKGLEWRWQSMDGAMTKAPLGGEKNRTEPYRPSQARRQTKPSDRRQRHSHGNRDERRQYTRQTPG